MTGMLIVVLVCLLCVAYQATKSTFVRSFAALIAVICAGAAAFGYFESLASLFTSRGESTRHPAIVPYAQTLCFVLLFVVIFGILQTVVGLLTRRTVDLGKVPELLGRAVCGILTGLFSAGLLLTALDMAPLSQNVPYLRFDKANPDPDNPNKVILNADGLVAGWYSLLSRGSLKGRTSLAAVHPQFINHVFLNRFIKHVEVTASARTIVLPSRQEDRERPIVTWPAPENLKDPDGNPIPAKSGHRVVIARVGISSDATRGAPYFRIPLAQLRIICKERGRAQDPLAGQGKAVYPAGYMAGPDTLRTKRLSEWIDLAREHYPDNSRVKWIDFAFYVPNNFVPVLLEFRQNIVLTLPAMASAEDSPDIEPFIDPSDRRKDDTEDSKKQSP